MPTRPTGERADGAQERLVPVCHAGRRRGDVRSRPSRPGTRRSSGSTSRVGSPWSCRRSGSSSPTRSTSRVDIIETRVNGLGVAEPEISPAGQRHRRRPARCARTAPGPRRSWARRPSCGSARCWPSSRPRRRARPRRPRRRARRRPARRRTTAPATTTTVPSAEADAAAAAVASCDQTAIAALAEIPTTKPADDKRKSCVVLTTRQAPKGVRLLLGATVMTGNDVDNAKKSFVSGQGNVVDMTLKDSGLQKFNALAAKSFQQPSPTDQVAIVLDGVVQSNPAFQSATFDDSVQISGSFTSRRGRRPRQADQLRRAAGAARGADGRRTCRRRSARTSSTPASPPASSGSRWSRSTCSSSTACSAWS